MWPAVLRLFLVLVLALRAAPTPAQGPLSEGEIKAAFVFNFIRFAGWPAGLLDSSSGLTVCVRNGTPLAHELAGVVGRRVHDRPLVLAPALPDSPQGCHVVVVDNADAAWVARVEDMLIRHPVLVVADGGEIAPRSAIIRMGLVGQKMVFDVEMSRARRLSLSLSSRMLQLAREVR